MLETVKGLILRETPIGDYDKIMTVLTAEHGKISVFARGAKRLKSPLFTPTQLFSYSEMTLYRSASTYYIRQGALVESFYHIRGTREGAALAGYLADVAADVSQEEQKEEALLRLILNCFYAIAGKIKPPEQIKAVFELRAAAEAGFRPDRVACAGCGKAALETYYFDVSEVFSAARTASAQHRPRGRPPPPAKARRTPSTTQDSSSPCFPPPYSPPCVIPSIQDLSVFLPLSWRTMPCGTSPPYAKNICSAIWSGIFPHLIFIAAFVLRFKIQSFQRNFYEIHKKLCCCSGNCRFFPDFT